MKEEKQSDLWHMAFLIPNEFPITLEDLDEIYSQEGKDGTR